MASHAVNATQVTIERYFEIALYLLIAVGFVTLAGTGKLDALSLIFVVMVLLARGALLVRGRNITIPVRWTNIITFAYAAFYLADFFFISKSFVYATVHLVLFVMAAKIFSVHRERDRVYLALLAFLMVLAAAILTVDTSFLFLFCLFLLLAIATFVAQEMKRSATAAPVVARDSETARGQLPRWVSALAVVFLGGIALLGTILFFTLPRRTGGYLSALAQSNELVTGFSNSVELGAIGEIKKSSAVVMHIKIDDDVRGDHTNLKWRGIALGLFDGRRWSNQTLHYVVRADRRTSNFNITHIGPPQDWNFNPSSRPHNPRLLSYRVLLEPIGTDVFFVAPYAVNIRGNYSYISGDSTGALFAGNSVIGLYDADSDISEPSPEELKNATGTVPPEIAAFYKQLPPLDPRVTRLAQDITATQSSPHDKAMAIQEYLDSNYRYTLQLPASVPRDPIANFLFERKEGHCEYFASAMAVMLRTIGIPARLVTGFRGSEFNDLNSTYIVRASSAHTWVEAYIAGYGWVTFDPTPPDPKIETTRWSRIGMYLDAMGEFWREWVINYDFAHQLTLHNQIVAGWQRTANGWRFRLQRKYRELLRNVRSADFHPRRRPLLVTALVFLLLTFGLNARRIARAWRRRRIAVRPEQAPRLAASIWYERMTRTLARRGCLKGPAQTPSEFASSIGDLELRRSVIKFTERYESARFGESSTDAEKLPEIYDEIAMIK